ncbi:hypothetical protein HDU76_009830 [Blyttiomyces sp. JEL0837]|nr:hypothetical protein HDU76_009830 [Blyttiomyces sp. JEL0837]
MLIAQAPQNQEFPDSLGYLSELDSLTLNNASLTGTISPSLGLLKKLDYLDLGNNYLTGYIPSSLGNLRALQYMFLNDNAFIGQIPDTFTTLTKLSNLSISNNCFDDKPLSGVVLLGTDIEDVNSSHGPKCNPPTSSIIATPTSSPTPAPSSSSSSSGLSTGAIAGIAAAGGVVLIGALVGLFMYLRNKRVNGSKGGLGGEGAYVGVDDNIRPAGPQS